RHLLPHPLKIADSFFCRRPTPILGSRSLPRPGTQTMGVVPMCACGRLTRLYALQDMSLANPWHYFACYKQNGVWSCFMLCKLRAPFKDDNEYVNTHDETLLMNVDFVQEIEWLQHRIRFLEADTSSIVGYSS
ncbi:hypothetical protein LINPERPRIM_LOCUS19105, partial [Linum perenne]